MLFKQLAYNTPPENQIPRTYLYKIELQTKWCHSLFGCFSYFGSVMSVPSNLGGKES
jgi:hypothetical protein